MRLLRNEPAGKKSVWLKSWNIKAEYLYVYFSNTNASQTGNNIAPTYPNQIFNYSSNFRSYLLRLGLNYKFNQL